MSLSFNAFPFQLVVLLCIFEVEKQFFFSLWSDVSLAMFICLFQYSEWKQLNCI